MDKKFERQIEYLKHLFSKGGPEPEEYGELSEYFCQLDLMVKKGIFFHDQYPFAWELMPKLFLTPDSMWGLATTKPHGYSGDFEMIDRIYNQWVSPDEDLYRWDRYFHEQSAPIAVRNRKSYFCSTVENKISENKASNQFMILDVGSGPARDVYELFQKDIGSICVDCIDQDQEAIDYAKKIGNGYSNQARFIRCNALRFRPLCEYDLVWSAGLFDYLNDKGFRFLLTRLIKNVKTGGEVIIGNFSENNPTKGLMEFGHWFLNYRSEERLANLAESCGILRKNIFVERESEGINLFLRIKKDN